MQPLAENALDGRFPAGVDSQLLPQPRKRRQRVSIEPLAQGRVVFGCGLDMTQGRELRVGTRGFAQCDLQLVLRLRRLPLLIRTRCLGILFRTPRRRNLLIESTACSLERIDCLLPGLLEPLHLRIESLAALHERVAAARQVRQIRLRQRPRTFILHELAARLVLTLLRLPERLLGSGQFLRLRALRRLAARQFFFGVHRTGRPHVQCLRQLRTLVAPAGKLDIALGMLSLKPLTRLFDMPKFRLMPSDFGIAGVEDLIHQNIPIDIEEHRFRPDGKEQIVTYTGCYFKDNPLSIDIDGDWLIVQSATLEVATATVQDPS